MNFKFACPYCGQRIGAADADVGTMGGCPSCGKRFKVPVPQNVTPSFLVARDVLGGAPPWENSTLTKETEVPPEDGPAKTSRVLSILALALSILPVLNLAGLALGIVAVVRSNRGRRKLAVCALVVCGVLLIPVNIGGYLAAGPTLHLPIPGMVKLKSARDLSPTGEAPKSASPKPSAAVTIVPNATSKIVEAKPASRETPDINPSTDLPGTGIPKPATSPVPALPPTAAPR